MVWSEFQNMGLIKAYSYCYVNIGFVPFLIQLQCVLQGLGYYTEPGLMLLSICFSAVMCVQFFNLECVTCMPIANSVN
jgi:hypothetical protein